MKLLMIAAGLAVALFVFAGCGGGNIVPDSIVSIYRVSPETPISTPSARGAITLHVGDDFQILVKRTTNDDNGTNTSDVTTVCTYRFSTDGLAMANTLGIIHGVAAGFTTLEVKFNPGGADPIDRCYLDITVLP